MCTFVHIFALSIYLSGLKIILYVCNSLQRTNVKVELQHIQPAATITITLGLGVCCRLHHSWNALNFIENILEITLIDLEHDFECCHSQYVFRYPIVVLYTC